VAQQTKDTVVERVKALAGPITGAFGLELVDVAYVTERGRRVLRVYIDKPSGVTVDDCGDVSKELGAALDVEDLIPWSYDLEVSSPGLDRPLSGEKDFLRFVGRKARIRTKEPVSGRKNFRATIEGAGDGRVIITDADGARWVLDIVNIEKARLEIEM
jgi:ribosome maturation factor RimP